jgi:hypothetical protein
MQDDTFQITGYGDHEGRATVLFDYQINGQVYSTEHFLDTYGEAPTADDLTIGLQNWLINEAKPQLVPPASAVTPDLEALIVETPPEVQ